MTENCKVCGQKLESRLHLWNRIREPVRALYDSHMELLRPVFEEQGLGLLPLAQQIYGKGFEDGYALGQADQLGEKGE